MPQHNGVVERFNRTLLLKIRALLLDSGFPVQYWDIVLRAAIFVYNRTPHCSIEYAIPLAKFAPNVSHHSHQIKRFGCLAYMMIPKSQLKTKFQARAVRTIFVGYLATGFFLYHPQTSSYFKTKHVRFCESMVYQQLFSSNAPAALELEILDEPLDAPLGSQGTNCLPQQQLRNIGEDSVLIHQNYRFYFQKNEKER